MGKSKSKKKKGGSKKNYSTIDDEEEDNRERSLSERPKGKGKGGKSNRKKNNGSYMTNKTDEQFRRSLEDGGSKSIIEMNADGNCLFRSISDQLYHDFGKTHDVVRKDVCDFMESNEDEFAVFLVLDEPDAEDGEDAANFEEYISGMREHGEWGGNLELVAASKLYRRNIMVYSYQHAFTIEHGSKKKSSGPDLLVSYHDNDHYNSVRDNNLKKPPPPIIYRNENKNEKEEEEEKVDVNRDDSEENKGEEIEELTTADKSNIKTNSNDNDVLNKSNRDSTNKKKKGGSNSSTTTKKRITKKEKCPCGSGLMYKKCCLSVEKSRDRIRKINERNGTTFSNEVDGVVGDNDERNDDNMVDGFKVLKI